MTDKISEITEKIYNEGVIKAKDDAEQLIAEAKNKANQIIESAKKKESEIIEEANKQAEENKKNINSEIQLAALQFTSNLKQKITNLVITAQIVNPIKESFNDTEFVKKIILTTIQNWNPQESEGMNLKVLLPEKDEKEFSDFLNAKAIDALNKGLSIELDAKAKNGFKIGPKDGNYIISFTDKDFENYFKIYLKENTSKLLFE
jgi:V/A-type H+-transporting ATPase subunit E